MQLRAIIRKSLQLRYAAALIKIVHLTDTPILLQKLKAERQYS
jgi:hypothetical protein